jgi:hypothetical protein
MSETRGAEKSVANRVPESGGPEEAFDVDLPFDPSDDAGRVAHVRGNRDAFLDIVAGFVRTGSELSAPLREPANHSSDPAVTLPVSAPVGMAVAAVPSWRRSPGSSRSTPARKICAEVC